MKTLKPGQIAAYCDVHHRTVSRWIAQGQLKGHKLPGRGNYRVLVDDFISFLRQQQMPVPPDLNEMLQHQQLALHATMSWRVLVICAEVLCCERVQSLLSVAGYQLDFAHDGFQAGVKLGLVTPDLVLLDWSMPGVDGAEVLNYLRQQSAFATTRVLVLSDSANQAQQALAADAVLLKSVENDVLLQQVQLLLQRPDIAD